MREVPRELSEAAALDGATRLGTLLKIHLPLTAPGLASVALLTFLFAWNEFLFAFTFTATEASRTVPVALALFPGRLRGPVGRHRGRVDPRVGAARAHRRRAAAMARARSARRRADGSSGVGARRRGRRGPGGRFSPPTVFGAVLLPTYFHRSRQHVPTRCGGRATRTPGAPPTAVRRAPTRYSVVVSLRVVVSPVVSFRGGGAR